MWTEASAQLYKLLKIATRWPGEAAELLIYPLVTILSLGILAYFIITQGAPVETLLFVFVGVVSWSVFEGSQRVASYGIMVDIFDDSMKHTFAGWQGVGHYVLGVMSYGLFASALGFQWPPWQGYSFLGSTSWMVAYTSCSILP
jgi:hypothetical protein